MRICELSSAALDLVRGKRQNVTRAAPSERSSTAQSRAANARCFDGKAGDVIHCETVDVIFAFLVRQLQISHELRNLQNKK